MEELNNLSEKEPQKESKFSLSLTIFFIYFIMACNEYLYSRYEDITISTYSPIQKFALVGTGYILFSIIGIVSGYVEVFKTKKRILAKLISILGLTLNTLYAMVIIMVMITIYQKIF